MSIEQEIAGLTQSTTDLLGAVNTKKATLDTAVSNAQTAVVDATSQVSLAAAEKVGAQSARDEAETHKDLAYTYSQSAASAVAYQDLTAIAESKAETAVDVFVYDTRKDSDGGAWRKRTQGTSWYNEPLNTATRGSRKGFPAVAVIVAEANKVTIYDGDDPSLPMWWTVSGSGNNSGSSLFYAGTLDDGSGASIFALNGGITLGVPYDNQNGGVRILNFAGDSVKRITASVNYNGYWNSIESVRDGTADTQDTSINPIVDYTVNDVAMTVLPNAPIDPDTGLPIPTIAVATDGGVSVIKDDGTVVDLTSGSGSTFAKCVSLGFTDENKLIFNQDSSGRNIYIYGDIPEQDTVATLDNNIGTNGYKTISYNTSGFGSSQFLPNTLGANNSITEARFNAIGTYNGLSKLDIASDISKSLASYITSDYNTGWMNGDIKLATLSDTDDTDLVGSELVTNGTFDTDISGWTAVNSTLSVVNGKLRVTSSGGDWGDAIQNFPVQAGKTYVITIGDMTENTGDLYWAVQNSGINTGFFNDITKTATFTPTSTGTCKITLRVSQTAGDNSDYDNISVRLAEPDRSVNNNGLQVFGTVTKEPVATGADLVAYSGFSATNYLEQPYNSDLDFGTGDFCIMGWFKRTSTGYHLLAVKADDSNNHRLQVYCNAGANNIILYTLDNGLPSYASTSNSVYTTGSWNHFVGVRSNSGIKVYINGKDSTATELNNGTMDLTSEANATFTLGAGDIGSGVQSPFGGSLALWRISGTAPTAEQVAKIYRDEKPLFQENAQATLHGTSDAVTALAYDDTTELLHVGTSAGRSVFSGLQRVDNTIDAVGTAISASDNFIAEE